MKAVNFDFRLVKTDGRYDVHLSVDGADPQVGEFEYKHDPDSRISLVVNQIEANNCRKDDLRDVGSHLWIGLIENDINAYFFEKRMEAKQSGAHQIFRLTLPPDLEKLPWETLYDEDEAGFLASNPEISILRTPVTTVQAGPHDARQRDKLRILAAVPEGSGLQYEHELNNLTIFAERLEGAVELEVLQGRVTPDRLLAKLNDKPWDILHFIGHGEVDEEDTVSIRLNSDKSNSEELWMEAETFADMFRGLSISLVVLNCCLGATPNPSRSLSGLGPYLLRAGVSSVVAMRYEIPDEVAIRFSNDLYRHLLSGDQPGRIDLAVQLARRTLHLNSTESKIRGFVTPVLYVAKDHEHLFSLPGHRTVEISHPIPDIKIPENLPEEIVDVFKDYACIPVIGPGILNTGAVRRGMPGLDPGRLAEKLASESQYPCREDFEAVKSSGDWVNAMLFQCVCQHYQFKHRRFKLVRSVQKTYELSKPPQSLINIAAWKVPGIIYTYFDGLMEEALRIKNKLTRTVVNLTEPIDAGVDVPLLVLLRGSLTNPDSLILTEDDHDRLLSDLENMSVTIADLTRQKPGRSLLLLGVSPRDPLIRRLCTQLLDSGPRRNQGPTFFVYKNHTEADQAYWNKFDVYWIEEELEEFIWALSDFTPGDGS